MKFAVLGLGSAGRRHADGLLELGHEVVGFDPALSSSPDGLELAASQEAALDAAEAVVIASPNSLHADQTCMAIEAGRHVLVEKPLAVDPADARRVVELARGSELVCGVAMNLRFHTALTELKRLVDSGKLGEIYFARASFGYDLRQWHPDEDYRKGYSARADLGGGIVLDAIHELDYLLWLLGPARSVSGLTAQLSDLELSDVEDIALAQIRMASGALAAVDLNFFEPAYRRGCLVVGSTASAEWNWPGAEIVTRSREGDSRLAVKCQLQDTYHAELVDFTAAIESDSQPKTDLAEGLAALELADAIKRSSDSGQLVELDG